MDQALRVRFLDTAAESVSHAGTRPQGQYTLALAMRPLAVRQQSIQDCKRDALARNALGQSCLRHPASLLTSHHAPMPMLGALRPNPWHPSNTRPRIVNAELDDSGMNNRCCGASIDVDAKTSRNAPVRPS